MVLSSSLLGPLLAAPPTPFVSMGWTGWRASLSWIGLGRRPKGAGGEDTEEEEEEEREEEEEDKGAGGGMGRVEVLVAVRTGEEVVLVVGWDSGEVEGAKEVGRWVKSGNVWGGVREIGESPS
jgi:hypothetical protein